MTTRPLCAMCLLLVLRPAVAEDAASDRLELSARPPVIPVSATAPGRRFIELPTLTYRFEVQTACGGDRTPRSLSISIADSRVALSGVALENRGTEELVLTVPAGQLAPIAVDDFCVATTVADDGNAGAPAADEPEDRTPVAGIPEPRHLLTVPAVVSAQASLVCGGEQSSNISYVTRPLAVTLACTVPARGVAETVRNAGDR